MSVLLGGHLPDLSVLDNGLFRSPLVGEATILIKEGGFEGAGADSEVVDQNIQQQEGFRFDNPLPPLGVGAQAGVEFQWHPNDRHSFIIGIGSWEKTSIARVTGNLPLQQYYVSNVVNSERRASLSYTEYTLGWQFNLVSKPKFKFYSRLSAHEVFDIDFREDFTFLFVKSPVEDLVGVRRVMVTEAQTASLFMAQLGFGMEWFLRDWLSLGFEGGYLIGERKFALRNYTFREDFASGDNVSLNGLPAFPLPDGKLGYLDPSTTPEQVSDADDAIGQYRPLDLQFDGWRALFKINFYY